MKNRHLIQSAKKRLTLIANLDQVLHLLNRFEAENAEMISAESTERRTFANFKRFIRSARMSKTLV